MRFTCFCVAILLLAAPGMATEGIAWEKSVEDALARAEKESKPIVVDFWADWCGWCKVQDKEIFAKKEMIEFSRDHVYIKLDTEDRSEGTEFAIKYGVSSLPTILVLGPDGKELDRIPGFVPLKEFIEELTPDLPPEKASSSSWRARRTPHPGSWSGWPTCTWTATTSKTP